jgi:hypothetical protein
MPTLYVDFENGDDNHGGTSFARLAQGTNGRITSTTFSSAGASFPNNGSLIGQYLSIFNGTIYAVYNITAWVSETSLTIAALSGGTALANQASDRQYFIGGRWRTFTSGATTVRLLPGDTVRAMGSPSPINTGIDGTWTSRMFPSAKTVTGATNTTPITITCASHGYVTGETVFITGVGGNSSANNVWEIVNTGVNTFTLVGSVGSGNYIANGTARAINNAVVRLASAVTQNIASTGPGRTAWISAGGANVVTSLASITKEGLNGDAIQLQTAFTTGRAAYWATGSLNLSAYQQVSFWIRQTLGTIGAAGAIDLRLCSDTTGTTAVNIISIPNLAVINSWMPVTVDLGVPLGSSIQSIALYVNTDNGSQAFTFSNIIACKASSAADAITLTSLIGKNTADETFWGIQSINGTRLILDGSTENSLQTQLQRGYYGVSGTVPIWRRETIKLTPVATAGITSQVFQESGAEGSPITYTGGWNRVDMSTQTLETWMDGQNGLCNCLSNGVTLSYVNVEKFAGVRANFVLNIGTAVSFCNFNIIAGNNCVSALSIGTQQSRNVYTLVHGCANFNNAITAVNALLGATKIFTGYLLSNSSNTGSGVRLGGMTAGLCSLEGIAGAGLIANSTQSGIAGHPVLIKNITTADNAFGISTDGPYLDFTLVDCLLSESSEFSFGANAITQAYSHNHDKTQGNHKIFMNGGLISAATDQRYTATGSSWKMQPTSTALRASGYPVILSLAKVACGANTLVTIKAWMRRDNAGLTMRLVCKGGQIAGVTSDVTSSVVAVNAWEEETITFTPTETGVVEITAEAWGGTTFSGWVDDLTISQA